MSAHLFVDVSSHGFGHLAQVAPVLNALRQDLPDLALTVRSGLPADKLQSRIDGSFEHLREASDFGFSMHDAVSIDFVTTARKYQAQHSDWPRRVREESALLHGLRPDLVLTDVSYLPLAGASQCGIPALCMCSLNWADLFSHYFGTEDWAARIESEILDAYCVADCFLQLAPAMPMPRFPNLRPLPPVAALGSDRRIELRERLGCSWGTRIVMVAFGGFETDLSVRDWPHTPGIHWLIPQSWPVVRPDMTPLESAGMPLIDLMGSIDAVLTKPGYGTFTEAACNGTAVLYLRRDNWPEQDFLIGWLDENALCAEIPDRRMLATGQIGPLLDSLLQRVPPPRPRPDGARQAAEVIAHALGRSPLRSAEHGSGGRTESPDHPKQTNHVGQKGNREYEEHDTPGHHSGRNPEE